MGMSIEEFEEYAKSHNILTMTKDFYESRLKSDLEAILIELQLEIAEHKMTSGVTNQDTWNECIACCSGIVQQKIDKLKEGT